MLRVTNPSPYMYLLHVPNGVGGTDFSIVGSSPEALVTVARRLGDDASDRRNPVARADRGRGSAAGKGTAGRRQRTRRAPDAGRPRPQRPRPGLHAGHRARRGLQPHRALQPRHAPGVDGDRDARRGPDRPGRGDGLLPGRHAVGRAEGAGHGADRGGGEDAPRPLRRRGRLPRLRRQRRLRDRHPHRADARRHRLRAGRRWGGGRLQRPLRIHRGDQQGARGAQRDRRRRDADRPGRRAAMADGRARPAQRPADDRDSPVAAGGCRGRAVDGVAAAVGR